MKKGQKTTAEIRRKISLAHKGKKLSEEHKRKIGKGVKNSEIHKLVMASKEHRRKLRICKLGNKNPMWKGDEVGYTSLHEWAKNHFPKTKKCQNCKKVPPYDLANISGKYRRDLMDWKWLCRRCHMLEDGRMKNLIKTGIVNCRNYNFNRQKGAVR